MEARFELDGNRLAIVVDDGEAEYPLTIDPLITQQKGLKLDESGGAAKDEIGGSVAISGHVAVIGAWGVNDGQGVAYIFERRGENWTQQQTITAGPGRKAGSLFGSSVAISGDTLVVGAYGAQNDQGEVYQGAAYISERSGAGADWGEPEELPISDGATGDKFGFSVAVSGHTVVIGASGKKIGANSGQGAAYVFSKSGSDWSEGQKLTAKDGAANHAFGLSVAVDGDTIVVGAPGRDSFEDAAYVFTE